MKQKLCSYCSSPLVRVGSNLSCTNENCENYVNKDYDSVFLDYNSYTDSSNLDYDTRSNVESTYEELYDDLLFFSDDPNYITRFEYRKMNDFAEDYLFDKFKIASFERFREIDADEFERVLAKYRLIDEGRRLESEDKTLALDFYKRTVYNKYFDDDYYIYRKIIKLESDPNNQVEWILKFFNAGIYCNRYNYLWFLKKLHILSQKVHVPYDVISNALKVFKNNSFTKKVIQESKYPIAEKIMRIKGKLMLKTASEYNLGQFRLELLEEVSMLNSIGRYEFSVGILEKLILNYGFKAKSIYKALHVNYMRIGEVERATRWIYAFFKFTKFNLTDKNQLWFEDKFNQLGLKTNDFKHDELFFDRFDYYISKEEFDANPARFISFHDYISLLKSKVKMILKGIDLENSNPEKAIEYYRSLLGHNLFKNDYYPYKSLMRVYHNMEYYEAEIDTILSFFKSGIYCTRYNYILFLYYLKVLSGEFIIYDDEINEALKSFKINSFENSLSQNSPAPLAERLIYNSNSISVMQEEDFESQQEIEALYMQVELLQSKGMFASANEIFRIIIDEYGIYDFEIYKNMCVNYQRLGDVSGEIKTIEEYFSKDSSWNVHDEKWFTDRYDELKKLKGTADVVEEPHDEILYENNEYYLTYDDFKAKNGQCSEFIDKCIAKLELRRKGYHFEISDREKALCFYEKLLNNELFKNDYFLYRRLVLLYDSINDFENVFTTIKRFFFSGTYCTRYQYIWFLHKLELVSKVKYISDDEITSMLKAFRQNGFKNSNLKNNPVILTERLYHSRYSIKIHSPKLFLDNQRNYEMREMSSQLDLNGAQTQSAEIIRTLFDEGDKSAKTYRKLCYKYRELGQLEDELEIINEYLSKNSDFLKDWFENRLNEVNELIVERYL